MGRFKFIIGLFLLINCVASCTSNSSNTRETIHQIKVLYNQDSKDLAEYFYVVNSSSSSIHKMVLDTIDSLLVSDEYKTKFSENVHTIIWFVLWDDILANVDTLAYATDNSMLEHKPIVLKIRYFNQQLSQIEGNPDLIEKVRKLLSRHNIR